MPTGRRFLPGRAREGVGEENVSDGRSLPGPCCGR